MARDPDEQVDFTTDDVAGVVGAMAELAAAGGGWVNVRPVMEQEDLPPPPGWTSLFSARSPTVLPVATWVAGVPRRDGSREPATIGIQHPVGRKVATRLVEAGLRPPATWRGRQDNPRRGLVVEVPADEDPAVVLDWLLRVVQELSPVPLTGDWRAQVFRPS